MMIHKMSLRKVKISAIYLPLYKTQHMVFSLLYKAKNVLMIFVVEELKDAVQL